jgi:3D (Asp-Asp-Asp) domain-containing protein
MRKIFAIALAALLLFAAGCACGGQSLRGAFAEPVSEQTTPAAPATDEPQQSVSTIWPQEKRSDMSPAAGGEGDVIPGELTFYCSCEICNGPGCAGVTADGTVLAELGPGDLPVVGCNWLPLHSLVEVGGTVYRVADRGGPGLNRAGRLDVYTPEGHEAALALGRVYDIEVRILALGSAAKY